MLKYLLCDLCIDHPQPIIVYCDSQVVIHIIENPIFHKCTKHIKIDSHFVHKKFKSSLITSSYLRSFDQLVSLFTKPLGGDAYKKILVKLGVLEITFPPPT